MFWFYENMCECSRMAVGQKCTGDFCCNSFLLCLTFPQPRSHTHACTCMHMRNAVSRWGLDWGFLGFCSLYFHIKAMSYWWRLTHTILEQHKRYGGGSIKHTHTDPKRTGKHTAQTCKESMQEDTLSGCLLFFVFASHSQSRTVSPLLNLFHSLLSTTG